MRNFNFQEPEKKVPNLTLSTTDTGAGSYAYSVTQTSKIITSSGERVHSTTSNKVCNLIRYLIRYKIDSEKPRGDEPIKYVCMYVCMFSFIKKSQFSDNVALKIDFKTMVHSFQPSSHENQED